MFLNFEYLKIDWFDTMVDYIFIYFQMNTFNGITYYKQLQLQQQHQHQQQHQRKQRNKKLLLMAIVQHFAVVVIIFISSLNIFLSE